MTRAMRSIETAFLVGVEGATEIWLVRHGDCYEGMAESPDPPLSPLGQDQAKRLAARIKRLGPVTIYSSPYRRAQETARTITNDFTIDPRLVETAMELGPNGELDFKESAEDVAERVSTVIDEITAAHPGERVIVVGHAAAFLAYLTSVMRLAPGTLRLLPYYTSVSVVRALGDRRMVGALADTGHLE
jgi:broad specificity phosphatase PhoE